MKVIGPFLLGVMAAACLLAPASWADAETCTLKLKRLESAAPRSATSAPDPTIMFRRTTPQRFYAQSGTSSRLMQFGVMAGAPAKPAFSEVISKEPAELKSDNPMREVITLGSNHYGFLIDLQIPPKDDESDAKPTCQLYFDANGNGDLTDDKVLQGEPPQARYPTGYAYFNFPRVDLTLDVDGEQAEYSFSTMVQSRQTGDFSYTVASIGAAAYLEGRIAIDGKDRTVVILDSNSNGRFDDEYKVRDDVRVSTGRVYTTTGDTLLLEAESAEGVESSVPRMTSASVSRLLAIGDGFYDMELSEGATKLVIEPTSTPLGQVSIPSKGFSAVICGELGIIQVRADEDSETVTLPEGEWQLISYSIRQIVDAKPATGADSPARPATYSQVSAYGTTDCKRLMVKGGQTVDLPFGAPFRPVVTSSPLRSGSDAALSMTLIGSGGEQCSGLIVNGKKPDSPTFTITADGQEVETGAFEYG